jgi:hypothetical protein
MRILAFLVVAILSAGCGGKQPAAPPSNTAGSGPPAAETGPGAAPALCDDPDCAGGTGTCLALCKGTDEQCAKECSREGMCAKVACPR